MSQTRDFPGTKVKAILDGDTLIIDIDLGFHLKLEDKRLRIVGIDAPEKNTSKGQAVKRWLEQRLGSIQEVTVRIFSHAEDKYGRLLGDIVGLGVVGLAEEMKLLGYARSYSGKGVKPWANEEDPQTSPTTTLTEPGSASPKKDGNS